MKKHTVEDWSEVKHMVKTFSELLGNKEEMGAALSLFFLFFPTMKGDKDEKSRPAPIEIITRFQEVFLPWIEDDLPKVGGNEIIALAGFMAAGIDADLTHLLRKFVMSYYMAVYMQKINDQMLWEEAKQDVTEEQLDDILNQIKKML